MNGWYSFATEGHHPLFSPRPQPKISLDREELIDGSIVPALNKSSNFARITRTLKNEKKLIASKDSFTARFSRGRVHVAEPFRLGRTSTV